MRIATYNFHKGGRLEHWQNVLAATRADLLFAQEARDPQAFIEDCFAPAGDALPHWEGVPRRSWGSAVFVRSGSGGEIAPRSVPGFAGWVVGGKVQLAGTVFYAFSVHMPTVPGSSYVAQGKRLLRALRRMRLDVPLVLGGDFNLAVGRRPESDAIRVSPGERAWLDAFERGLGLVSSWQAFHPGKALAQTLRWRRNAEPAYHCDGIFIPVAWQPAIKHAAVHAGDTWTRLSDHNPVEVELDFPPRSR
ncbi:MAG: endonuclease/exonuclease/phosphatase family protein [Thermoanaerobaculia bacterium]